MQDRTRRLAYLACITLLASGLVAHAASYVPFFYDDSLISLRYADRLLHGQGLTWTDGERVEGYSDLLWILACAALGALGMDLVLASRVLGVVCALATCAGVAWAGRRAPSAGALAVAFLAASGSLAVWSIAGLETSLLAACLAWGIALLLEATRRSPLDRALLAGSGIAMALAALTRPDAPLLLAGGVVLLARRERPERVRALALHAGPTVIAVSAQLLFRWSYYGDVVPNSAHVKLAITPERVAQGAQYVASGALEAAGLFVPGIAALAMASRRPERRGEASVLAVSFCAWALYLAAIGGDVLPARRHFVPLVVLLALAIAELAPELLARWPGRRLALAGAAVLAWLAFVVPQTRAHEIVQVRSERWEWEGRTLGHVLHDAFADRAPLVAVDPAGCVPYFSRLPSLDMLGLNDRHIGSAEVRDFGRGPLGHERGDGAYVLSRAPDLVLFCGPRGARRACFRSGRAMERDPRWARAYRPMVVVSDAPALRSILFARLASPRIGVTEDRGEVHVPAYLFADGSPHVAAPTPSGALALRLDPSRPATLTDVPLPSVGPWEASTDGDEGVVARVARVIRDGDEIHGDLILTSARATELRRVTLRSARGTSPSSAAQ